MDQFFLFALIGFLAQLVDGSLGMGYGVVSSTALLSLGVPPAQVSACVHAAKLFTSGTSAYSHQRFGNVERSLFLKLALLGAIGGSIGAFLVSIVPSEYVRPVVMVYLCVIGLLIVYRAWLVRHPITHRFKQVPARVIGAVGGFVDGVGGGGWGPVVTSSLIGSGANPRYTVGTTNAAEFVVTLAVIVTFIGTGVSGLWQQAGEIRDHAIAVAGLIVGGVPSAILAGYLPRHIDARKFSGAIGMLVLAIGIQQLWKMAV
jgi:uncharacterized membrane protein YfcA